MPKRIRYKRGNNLIQDLIKRVLPFMARIGSDPKDDDEIRLQKSLLVVCAIPFIFAGAAWGIMYILFNEPLAGAIPLSYSIISLFSTIHFGRTRQYQFFRFSQLTLILLLPFFLMVALGGFVNGSAVVLWSLICPLGAMLFDEPRQAPRWFLAFISLVALSGFLYTKKGKELIFSVLVNNHQASGTEVRRAVEKFLQEVRNKY